ncbi:Gfo/Idh/MocA family oxidoreductase [Coraliomargarita sp. SDUM461004]|uniref:Gfo/Idh/MocA family oxidoreductase n=1 Tax=Thalassobacterium sedimentorum TaxID=3041258 RepID=A0ABU1AEX2_9BACT|nr:Gfo/Idh/MocA family oxidoreductase [Coraliomargarita sp. SDUM461004]MDQ8193192.1 Gfo/Idh/MocA family oxidoreductase [Coraliomargarita sp. SDUM461004]
MPPIKRKTSPIRVAIIGTGGMAIFHARKFKQTRGCRLTACVDTDPTRLASFAAEHSISEAYTSTTELLANAKIDAVAIVTPDPYHKAIALECLTAGKHVLCEKPLALNYPDAKAMADAADKADVINMVHFTYRNWAPLQKITDIVQAGEIGEVRHLEASYHQSWLVSKQWGEWRTSPNWLWRLSTDHGSKGVLGDVGVHILDFATYPAGKIKEVYCHLKTFKKAPRNRIGRYKLDANDTAVMTVEFANGAIGSIQTTRWMTGHLNRLFLKISGTQGSVSFDSELSDHAYKICKGADIETDTWKIVETKATPDIQQRFIKSIRTGLQDQPDFRRGAEIQKLLDASFKSSEQKKPIRVR